MKSSAEITVEAMTALYNAAMIEPPRPMRAKNVPATEARIATAADDQVVDDLRRREVDRAEEHHRDQGDGVGLEEVGGHPRAVADVVAHVVRDHGGFRGSSSGIPASTLPTRSAPTSAAFV